MYAMNSMKSSCPVKMQGDVWDDKKQLFYKCVGFLIGLKVIFSVNLNILFV